MKQPQNKFPKDFETQIKEFNELYGLPVSYAPCIPMNNFVGRMKELKAILIEEVYEVEALIANIEAGRPELELLTELADWLGDLQVYCASEMCKFGLNNNVILSIIMASNMSKLGADGKPIMKDGKVMKGPDYWKPEPMIAQYIRAEWLRKQVK